MNVPKRRYLHCFVIWCDVSMWNTRWNKKTCFISKKAIYITKFNCSLQEEEPLPLTSSKLKNPTKDKDDDEDEEELMANFEMVQLHSWSNRKIKQYKNSLVNAIAQNLQTLYFFLIIYHLFTPLFITIFRKKTTFPCLFFFFFLLLSSLFQPFSTYSPPFLPFILNFIHSHILFTHIHHFHFSISFISSFHFFFTNYHLFFSSFFFSHHLYNFFLFFFYLLSTTFSPFLPSSFPFHLLFTKYPWGTVQLFILYFKW